ncbi:aminodeoxychorismate lyase [Nesterenkonia sp. AY15]|uniref:aminodeoxychorismate lyase n=1 Tax=unclassified Nesterenkonia TaxID=2629769 RepID=UPI001F4CBC0B|nr:MULTISPECIES: aminodeoxychorismate lyase [unclassified Nesterenkonia]MCH8562267.1 aminodeoxychorismate lyase [Nesterenkonia sp. YGD6]MCH8569830.1 aminodeoxychorismate lyase [Nesterenkonia sp. AY15]
MAEHFRDDSVAAVAVRIDAEHPTGAVFDPHQPQLRITDLGAIRGDGIFETMHAINGTPRKLDAHLARLRRSAGILDIGIPPRDSWEAAVGLGLEEYRARGGVPEELAIKLVATRGVENEPASEDPAFAGTYWLMLTPVAESMRINRGKPLGVTLLDRGYDSTAAERAPWLLLGAKTLSYAVNMAALRHADAGGFDDVIFITSDGQVLEGPTSTVLIAEAGAAGEPPTLITPVLETGILPGTTQGAIFTAAERAGWKLGYGPLTPEDLYAADHVWLLSSVRLAAPVNRIDEHELAVDPELTAQLNSFLDQDLPVNHPVD